MAAPAHKAFRLTSGPTAPLRQQIARCGLLIAGVLLVASGFVMCACWPLMVSAGFCVLPALAFGPLRYRAAAVILLLVFAAAGILDYRSERRTMDSMRRAVQKARSEASP